MIIEKGKIYKTRQGLVKIMNFNDGLTLYSLPNDDKIRTTLSENLFYSPFEMVQQLTGHLENGTKGVLSIYQDDTSKDWVITFKRPNSYENLWTEYADTFQNVIFKAFQKHGE